MTNFDKFNPNNNNPVNFLRFGKATKPENDALPADSSDTSGSQADLSIPPEDMLNLLAAQGQNNMSLVGKPPLFTGFPSVQQHSQITAEMASLFEKEFGQQASPDVLQEMVDNYIIGSPVINA